MMVRDVDAIRAGRTRAVVERINENDVAHRQYGCVDDERREERELAGKGCFHAEFRRACPLLGWSPVPPLHNHFVQAHGLRGGDGIVYLARRVRVAAAGEWLLSVGHDGGRGWGLFVSFALPPGQAAALPAHPFPVPV